MNSVVNRHFHFCAAPRTVHHEQPGPTSPSTSEPLMNKPLTMSELAAARSLAGRVSLITGSTSGIGLGIARALAAAGSAVVLNGFGNPREIAATRAELADEFGVTVQYSGA